MQLERFSPQKHLYPVLDYVVMNGGKRLRPLLVYRTSDCLGLNLETSDAIACAIELVHCYSLAHDDLPAMDNAKMRRGKPSCHIKFDEASAILSGDALIPLAFKLINEIETHSIETKSVMLDKFSDCIGGEGLVAGQMLDLKILQQKNTHEQLERIYDLKTGCLFVAAMYIPALVKRCNISQLQNIEKIAIYLGRIFQIKDDLLDIESHATNTGKPSGLDKAKYTLPKIIVLVETRKIYASYIDKIKFLLEATFKSATPLLELVEMINTRTY
ncbi:MAG: polyprenyl synthetase family protein [Pseudomonadota bacterium]